MDNQLQTVFILTDKPIVSIKPEEMADHPLNKEIFSDLPDERYVELKEDIRARGIHDPLHIVKIRDVKNIPDSVLKSGKEYVIISGHQRKRIADEIGIYCPCVIHNDFTENWQIEEALIKDNSYRRQLSDPEIARASSHLLEIEKIKAKQRQGTRTDLLKGNIPEIFRESDKHKREANHKVAEVFGISGRQLEKMRYVETKAPEPIKQQWKDREISTNGAYKQTKEIIEESKLDVKEPSKITFNRTNENIEWAKWSWNPYTGCKHNCTYCYARDIATRFYVKDGFKPTYHENRLVAPDNTKISEKEKDISGIHNVFVCSMADLFGDWVPKEHIQQIIDVVARSKQWNFLFLTKNPKRLTEFIFPDNAWVGTTVDVQQRVKAAEESFKKVKAKIKFVSCEPLREKIIFEDISLFDWLIVGGQSKTSNEPERQPEWCWVESLLNDARKNNVKVYFKPNMRARPQEYPAEGDNYS